MKEESHRSVAKTITWRIIASLTTAAVVFVFTRKLLLSIGVGGAEGILKLVFYYLHERVWNRVTWGKT